VTAARQLELVAGIFRQKPAPLRRTRKTFLLELEPEDLERILLAQGLSPLAFWTSVAGGRQRLGIALASTLVRSFRRSVAP
jgi:hypothetical protein